MTVTKQLKDQVADVSDTNLDLRTLDETKWKQSLYQSQPTSQRALYTFDTGSPAYKTQMEITSSASPLDGLPAARGQIKLITPLVATNDETSLTTKDGKLEVWMGFAVTADATVDEDDVAAWIEQLIRTFFPTITSGAAVNTRVGSLLRGNVRLVTG